MVEEVEYKGVKIRVIEGDITELDVDAIVNPANSYMIMGGGVAGAIKRKGGKIIEDEARRRAPVPVGEAIATTAGRLKAKYVIHAPTMPEPAMRIGLENVEKATRAALTVANDIGVKSIAFPGMGTGVGGIPHYDAAKTMLKVIRDHIDFGTGIKEIILVAWGKEAYNEFVRALKEVFGQS